MVEFLRVYGPNQAEYNFPKTAKPLTWPYLTLASILLWLV